VLQFAGTFGVWILAEHLRLSAIVTVVVYAVTVARDAPAWVPARQRVPSYAVWETLVFILNVLAFVLIGLQLRPILGGSVLPFECADAIRDARALIDALVDVRAEVNPAVEARDCGLLERFPVIGIRSRIEAECVVAMVGKRDARIKVVERSADRRGLHGVRRRVFGERRRREERGRPVRIDDIADVSQGPNHIGRELTVPTPEDGVGLRNASLRVQMGSRC
jgi:hypothetical protein